MSTTDLNNALHHTRSSREPAVELVRGTWKSVEDFSRPRSTSLFGASIIKVLKQVHPDTHLSPEGSRIVEDMLAENFHTISMCAYKDFGPAFSAIIGSTRLAPEAKAAAEPKLVAGSLPMQALTPPVAAPAPVAEPKLMAGTWATIAAVATAAAAAAAAEAKIPNGERCDHRRHFPESGSTCEGIHSKKIKGRKSKFLFTAQLLRKTNLEDIFSDSRSGTIAHKNKKRITAVTQ